jgi:hypothetical protein
LRAILAIKKVAAYGRFGSVSGAKAAEKKNKIIKNSNTIPINFSIPTFYWQKRNFHFFYITI